MKTWEQLRDSVRNCVFGYLNRVGVDDPDVWANRDVDALIEAVRKDEREHMEDQEEVR